MVNTVSPVHSLLVPLPKVSAGRSRLVLMTYAIFRLLVCSNVNPTSNISNSSFQSPSPHFLSFSEIPARGRLFTKNFVTTGGSWRFKQGFFLRLHTGKDFGSLLYVIPSGPLAQIDRQTSKVGRK